MSHELMTTAVFNKSRTSVFVALVCLCVFLPQWAHAVVKQDAIAGELLVQFKNTTSAKRKLDLRQQRPVKVKARFDQLKVEHWKVDEGVSVEALISELSADPDVAFVEPNYRRYPRAFPTLYPGDASSYQASQQTYFDQMNLPALWYVVTNPDVVVAVMDNAFNIAHKDLEGNLVPASYWRNFTDPNKLDYDVTPQDGCIDADTGLPLSGLESHGTEVMGVVGAKTDNNGIGISGTSWNAKILPIKIGCAYSVASELEAFDYILGMTSFKPSIINASYGGPQYSQAERIGILKLIDSDILFVAAAGNADMDNDLVRDYPSSLDIDNIISVAAIDANDRLAAWSQYGKTTVDIAAPGVGMYVTTANGGYDSNDGTSFSAPALAGVAALLKGAMINAGKTVSFRDLKGAMLASAVPLPADEGRLISEGKVDAHSAYLKLKAVIPEPVLVIESIAIDDSVTGNGNGMLDADERTTLVLTVKNEWGKAVGVGAVLSSDLFGDKQPQSPSAIDIAAAPSPSVEFRFDLPVISNYQPDSELLMTLTLGWFNSNSTDSGSTVHKFRVHLGQLINGQSASGVLHQSGDYQDDLDYYHVTIGEGKHSLTINLDVPGESHSSTDINLLVKYNGFPQFDYQYYLSSGDIEGDVVVGKTLGGEHIQINNPKAGTYYIAVLTADSNTNPDLPYTLTVNTNTRIPRPSVGCSFKQADGFDPTLPLLMLLSLWAIGRRSRQCH